MEERDTRDLSEVSPRDQSTIQLVRSIGNDTATLVRKEIELGKQEILEAITARAKAFAAFGAAGLLGLFGMVFLALAGAHALQNVVAPWLSYLIVGGGFLFLVILAGVFGIARAKRPPMKPEETVRTVKEDMEWARAQLKR